MYCQTCIVNTETGDFECFDIDTHDISAEQPPLPPGPKVAPENILPGGGVFEQLPTTPTTPTTPSPPPLFGRNVGNVPLGGFFGPTTPALTPPPQFGQTAPEGQVQPPPTTSGGEGGQETQSRTTSPTGYCVPFNKITCVPCDPGLPGADCIPQSEWPPASTTGEDIPQAQLPTEEEEEEEEQPLGTLSKPPVAGMAPEAEIAPDDEGTQPQIQDDGAAEE
jgi:hypothetical protein